MIVQNQIVICLIICTFKCVASYKKKRKQAQKDLTDSVKLQSRDSAYNTNAKTDYAKGDSMKIMTENINSNVNQASPIKKKSASQADVSTTVYVLFVVFNVYCFCFSFIFHHFIFI